jgi:hypothetical protein
VAGAFRQMSADACSRVAAGTVWRLSADALVVFCGRCNVVKCWGNDIGSVDASPWEPCESPTIRRCRRGCLDLGARSIVAGLYQSCDACAAPQFKGELAYMLRCSPVI